MGNRLFGVLDMAIVGVPVIGFIVWQLIAVHRPAKGSEETPRHPVGEHREDDG